MPQAIPHAVSWIKSVLTCTFHLLWPKLPPPPRNPCPTLEPSSGFLFLCDSCDRFELRSVTSPPSTSGFGDATRSLSTLHSTEGTAAEPPHPPIYRCAPRVLEGFSIASFWAGFKAVPAQVWHMMLGPAPRNQGWLWGPLNNPGNPDVQAPRRQAPRDTFKDPGRQKVKTAWGRLGVSMWAGQKQGRLFHVTEF